MSVSVSIPGDDYAEQPSAQVSRTASFLPLVLLSLYAFWSQYFALSILAGGVLSLIVFCFWRPYTPAVMLYVFGFVWLEAFAIIFYSDFMGAPIEQLITTTNAERLLYATFTQIAIMAVVANIFFNRKLKASFFLLARHVYRLNTKRVLLVYFIGSLLFPTMLALAGHGTLSQVAQSIATLRVVFLLMLAFIVMVRRNEPYRWLIFGIFVIEFLLGFVSFFSNFKEVAIMLFLVYLTVTPGLKLKTIFRLIPALAVMIVVLVFWSRVKDDYRAFLNGGSGHQYVNVGKTAALSYLADKASNFSGADFDAGVEILIFRVQGMAYYLEVYNRMPKPVPFANGQNLRNTVDFVLVPRALNPDKPILDPSAKLSYYTGRKFKGAAEGTSIAMGFFADFFTDYGLWLMIVPLLVLAILMGWLGNIVVRQSRFNMALNYSILLAFMMNLGFDLLSDSAFVLGNLRNYVFIYLVCYKLVFPWLNRFLSDEEPITA